MAFRRSWLVALLAGTALACGGHAADSQPGSAHAGAPGAGGGSSASAGHAATTGGTGSSAGAGQSTSTGGATVSSSGGNASPSGGSANGEAGGSVGGGNGGDGGFMIGCCFALQGCPAGEQQVSTCVQQGTCHTMTSCCGEGPDCCVTFWCEAIPDRGSDASAGDAGAGGAAGNHECHGTTCTGTQACVAYRTVGGAVILSDGGTCPAGQHLDNGHCQADFAYTCAALHGGCPNGPVTCGCAEATADRPDTCPTGYNSCSDPAPGDDSSIQLICERDVP